MTTKPTCLVVGGGIAGMATAIVLRRLGIAVDLIDLDPEWRVYGAGISITRPTLRAFRDLGFLDAVIESGFAGEGIQICTVAGEPIGTVDDPAIPGEVLPGSGGIMRPELHRILSSAVRSLGTNVRLGLTIDALEQDDSGVTARFSDGTEKRYAFLIGADGLYSRVRSLILPDALAPSYTGQTVWRLFAPRPPAIVRRHFFLGGPMKLGVCPVSATHMYMFLLEHTPRRPIIPDDELYLELRGLMAAYGGPIARLREDLGQTSQIVVRPLESLLLPAPWYTKRALILGDAAHPTTPQLASGAGMAVEDALVLGEELQRAGLDVPGAFAGFMARRWERCRLVVENSIEIGRREQAGRPAEEQTLLVAQSLKKLAEPI